ncbi:hypothetical protein [Bradyrhizobium sp. 139]|uniref:hypothetical protein n=1 Tax=Bradyrhizobium sp. 139 TaxID=2782616 RepID=UPI001FFADC88|nr:hypothetical protein [Bradyrhizobium sp. 139]
MHQHLRRIFLLLGLASSFGASSALAADPSHGSDLATRWYASCRVVANGQADASATKCKSLPEDRQGSAEKTMDGE